MAKPTLIGRSSSHFTRAARIVAGELGVAYDLRPVLDLTSLDPLAYGDNPALKIPVLVDEEGALFGLENVCRAWTTRPEARGHVVLRGETRHRLVANAEELTLHVMSSEVALVMPKLVDPSAVEPPKTRASLENALAFLDHVVDDAIAALAPEAARRALPAARVVSFLEVALFCAVTHLEWRKVADVTRYARLGAFVARFAERPSARETEYRFDAPPAGSR